MERLISRAKKYPIRPFPLRRIDCAKKGYIMDDARNRIATSNCMGILRCKHTTFVQTKRINPKDFNNLLRWAPKHLSDTQMRFEHTISSTPSSSRPQSTINQWYTITKIWITEIRTKNHCINQKISLGFNSWLLWVSLGIQIHQTNALAFRYI